MEQYFDRQTQPAPYPPYPPQPPYVPYPPQPQLSPKQLERRALRKTANGLGFFVLAYYLIMQVVAIVISLMMSASHIVTTENQTALTFMMQIIASIASSVTAVLFYRLFSKKRLNTNLPETRVKPDLLIPMVFLGMGAAMIANQLSALFDQNISLFQLENAVPQSTDTSTLPEMILYLISTAIVPALAEELAFRGVFMNVMRKFGDPVAIVSSAVLFGAMHGNTSQIVFAFVLGLIFAYVDCKTNSIIPSIIIHFANNFYAVTIDMFSGSAGLSDEAVTSIHVVVVSLFSLLGILSFIYLAKRDRNIFRVADSDESPFAGKSLLTLKEKFTACFTSVGMIISLALFASEMMLNLIPTGSLENLLRSALGG